MGSTLLWILLGLFTIFNGVMVLLAPAGVGLISGILNTAIGVVITYLGYRCFMWVKGVRESG
jgi:hypothetical protein